MKKDKLLVILLVVSVSLLLYFTLFYKSSSVKFLNGGKGGEKTWYVIEDHNRGKINYPQKFEDIRYFKFSGDWMYEFGSVTDMAHPLDINMYRLDNDSTLSFRNSMDTTKWDAHHIKQISKDTLYIERYEEGTLFYGLKMVNKDAYKFETKESPIKIGQ